MSSSLAEPAPSVVDHADDRSGPVAAGSAGLGVLLIVLAVPASSRLTATDPARWLTVAALVLAVLAAVTGLGAVLLGVRGPVRRPATRIRLTVVSVALVAAAVVATGAAVVALQSDRAAQPSAPNRPGLSVRYSGLNEGALVVVRADLPDVAAGDLVRAEIVSVQAAALAEGEDEPGGAVESVLAQEVTTARAAGPVSVDLQATLLDSSAGLRVLVESPHQQCTATLDPRSAATPALSCKKR